MENLNMGFPEELSRATRIEATSKDIIKGNILDLENGSEQTVVERVECKDTISWQFLKKKIIL